MPGIPCVYYGSEWGTKASKSEGDPALRVSFEKPEWNELTDFISKLADIKKQSEALNYGDFKSILLTNRQCIFERQSANERILVCINADENEYNAFINVGCSEGFDLLTGSVISFNEGLKLQGYSASFIKL